MNNEDTTYETIIVSTLKNGRLYTKIKHPPEQTPMSVSTQTHLLASAISMLIKSSNKYDLGVKDYNLLKEVINHLEDDFVSNDAYLDVEYNNKKNKK